jgi:undecaprenyl diphosphate synthase
VNKQADSLKPDDKSGGVPRHVAIIMDGNGRWARQRGLPRIKGHQEGAQSVIAAVKACQKIGIKYLTLYAFSVENWCRPREEIEGLMALLKTFLKREEKMLHKQQIRLRVIGRLQDLPQALQSELQRVCAKTSNYDKGHLTVALSYGGRDELVEATRKIAAKVLSGELALDDIDEQTIAANLYAPELPDPDLMIRTSGELRISNFLLWELSYSELYFTKTLWPDFREKDLQEAVADYARRRRRFGDIE